MGTPAEDTARDSASFDQKLWEADGAYLESLGWGVWEKGNPLRLCPVPQWEKIPTGMKVHSISGDSRVVGRDHVDMDYRFGCLAFGIVPGDTGAETAPTAEEVKLGDKRRQVEFVEKLSGSTLITPSGTSTDPKKNREFLMSVSGLTEEDMTR